MWLDNRPFAIRQADAKHIDLDTYGFHWVQLYPLGGVILEHVLWGALQGGSWGPTASGVLAHGASKLE